jgi:hypothetical protein
LHMANFLKVCRKLIWYHLPHFHDFLRKERMKVSIWPIFNIPGETQPSMNPFTSLCLPMPGWALPRCIDVAAPPDNYIHYLLPQFVETQRAKVPLAMDMAKCPAAATVSRRTSSASAIIAMSCWMAAGWRTWSPFDRVSLVFVYATDQDRRWPPAGPPEAAGNEAVATCVLWAYIFSTTAAYTKTRRQTCCITFTASIKATIQLTTDSRQQMNCSRDIRSNKRHDFIWI